MDGAFWVGLALAVPLSIVANLLTPAAQRWLAERNDERAAKQQAEQAEFMRLVEVHSAFPAEFSAYLLVAVLETTFVGAVFGLGSGIAFALGSGLEGSRGPFLLGQLLALFGTLAVMNIARSALRMARAVRQLRAREREVDAELSGPDGRTRGGSG